ncbi:MAG: hypothetical protein KBS72_07290 [Bacteroidales bacterium]|nr:hypothetical protein [Candidatus Cacconaster scatequi]
MYNSNDNLRWFAIRMIRDRKYILRYIELEGIETSRINDIRTLLFLHCKQNEIETLRGELWDRALFYRDAARKRVQQIPDNVMKTFLILAPYHDEPVFYLPVDDPSFFEGKHKRVRSGIFAGCEGVIKRIKGERRLIIRISDRAAVATPYIPQDMLEDIE